MKSEQRKKPWWIKQGASLDEMTEEESREFMRNGGGCLPPRFQNEYLEVIKSEHKDEYDHCHKDIWDRLIVLDSNLTVLEELDQSVVMKTIDDTLVMSSTTALYVLQRMGWAVYGESILTIFTLLYDKDKRSLALNQFKASITNKWIKNEYQTDFQCECNVFEKHKSRINELEPKVKSYRNHWYAHRASDPTKLAKTKIIGLPTLRELFKIAAALFGCCAVWHGEHGYLSADTEDGIRAITDSLIKDGLYVNRVERRDGWVRLTPDQLAKLNEMRARYGKPPIAPSDLKWGVVEK